MTNWDKLKTRTSRTKGDRKNKRRRIGQIKIIRGNNPNLSKSDKQEKINQKGKNKTT